MVIEVYYFGIRVHTETRDLCEELSCPVSEGDFVLSHTQTLPGITPPVSFTSENLNLLPSVLFFFFRHAEFSLTMNLSDVLGVLIRLCIAVI